MTDDPEVTDQVMGAVPVATKVVVGYTDPAVPVESEVGEVIAGGTPPELLAEPKLGPTGPVNFENILTP
jgi:hypothetical protein